MARFEKGGQLGWYHEHGLEGINKNKNTPRLEIIYYALITELNFYLNTVKRSGTKYSWYYRRLFPHLRHVAHRPS